MISFFTDKFLLLSVVSNVRGKWAAQHAFADGKVRFVRTYQFNLCKEKAAVYYDPNQTVLCFSIWCNLIHRGTAGPECVWSLRRWVSMHAASEPSWKLFCCSGFSVHDDIFAMGHDIHDMLSPCSTKSSQRNWWDSRTRSDYRLFGQNQASIYRCGYTRNIPVCQLWTFSDATQNHGGFRVWRLSATKRLDLVFGTAHSKADHYCCKKNSLS